MTTDQQEMKIVWKYYLDFDARLRMPRGAEVLHFDDQAGTLCLWALVNPKELTEVRHFLIVGTGWCRDLTGLTHIGTAQQGTMVLHLFEDTRKEAADV